jgi:hypothetical protein
MVGVVAAALIANHARSNDGEQAWGIEGRYKKAWRVAVPSPGRLAASARLLLLLVSKTRLAFMWTVAIFSVDLGVCDVCCCFRVLSSYALWVKTFLFISDQATGVFVPPPKFTLCHIKYLDTNLQY